MKTKFETEHVPPGFYRYAERGGYTWVELCKSCKRYTLLEDSHLSVSPCQRCGSVNNYDKISAQWNSTTKRWERSPYDKNND